MDLQQLSSNVQDAREEYKCLICWNYMRPPMYQCRNGHTICSKCKALLRANLDGLIVCPTCNIEIENIRCLALEGVAEALQYPCENNFRGCQEIILGSRKLEHERTCDFRPFNCPYSISDCSFAEPILPLVDHLIDCHKVEMRHGSTFDYQYVMRKPCAVKEATWMLTVFHCFGQYFCLHVEAFHINATPVYFAFLQFMGNEVEARDYFYSLEAGGNER